jgi:hypothetical protein
MAVNETGFSASLASVAGAIRRAARATGASFDYLLATAKVESNLNPGSKAPSSSATGLFQFIDQTWLATLKQAGPALGYGDYAKSIVQAPDGNYAVSDPSMREAVLKLRRDPAANAAMAGAFTQHNSAELQEQLGRPATAGELYIAHFLGSAGAAKLITRATTAPATPAADLFPGAAGANRSIFYDSGGRARGAGEVYNLLVGRFETARAHTTDLAGQTLAYAAPAAAKNVADPAGTLDAFAAVSAVPVARTEKAASVFHSLFQTEGSRQPISPVVGALWGGGASLTADLPPPSLPAPVAPSAVHATLRHLPAAGHEGFDLQTLYLNARDRIRSLFDGTS